MASHLRLVADCAQPEPASPRELGELEAHHKIRRDPRVRAAAEARTDFRRSPLGRAAVLAEIEGRLGGLDPETRERYDACEWNACVTWNQVRHEVTGPRVSRSAT